ncbi:MAG TPA: hypothetical protein VFK30_01175 [Anaerolineae bacterium]|nr:hypothetical protein [Anaerolineae bacterium]
MQHRGAVAEHSTIPKLGLAWIGALICAMAMVFMLLPAIARDNGQWENSDPMISEWFRSLKQPDRPTVSCCGVADAYWADGLEVRDGQVIAIITDTRPDEPLGRPHVAVGTRVIVPPQKMKWDRGNPTGHIVIFLNNNDGSVYCYVTGTGI